MGVLSVREYGAKDFMRWLLNNKRVRLSGRGRGVGKMSIYETAQQLAQQIKESDEYRDFIVAKELMKADEGHYKMIRDFQMKQFEIQQAQLFQLDISQGKQQELERLYSLLSLNPAAREYLEAEFRISRMINDVQKIIGEAIIDVLPLGFEDNDQPQILA
ncbi:hypothetical protein HMPREF0322_01090 [Desulfitobacterium hafniense DP7]|nr:hypothetical protein HMPREF0322_01090 [Desulfitobacterium hafniense DP7]